MPPADRTKPSVDRDEDSIEYLEGLLADAENTVRDSIGVARVQAIKLCQQLSDEIDRSRRALIVTKDDLADLSEAQLLERLDEAARGMPAAHLEVFVRAWLAQAGWELTCVDGELALVRPDRDE